MFSWQTTYAVSLFGDTATYSGSKSWERVEGVLEYANEDELLQSRLPLVIDEFLFRVLFWVAFSTPATVQPEPGSSPKSPILSIIVYWLAVAPAKVKAWKSSPLLKYEKLISSASASIGGSELGWAITKTSPLAIIVPAANVTLSG